LAISALGVAVYRRGIDHPAIQPEAVEFVAEIVMRLDIPAASRGRVRVDPVRDPVEETKGQEARQSVHHRRSVARAQFDQRLDVVAFPIAFEIAPREADVALRQQPSDPAPVQETNACRRSRKMSPPFDPISIRQFDDDLAGVDERQKPLHHRAAEPAGRHRSRGFRDTGNAKQSRQNHETTPARHL
jgi:hypothetical protein